MRPDPNAKILGPVDTEGRPSRSVVSDVPSRREVACDVVGKLAGRLGPDDLLTLVAFDDQAHVLATGLSPASSISSRSSWTADASTSRLIDRYDSPRLASTTVAHTGMWAPATR